MLWKTTDIIGCDLQATDGAIGTVEDLLFDEQDWTVRWVVAETGNWLHDRKVLLPPEIFGKPNTVARTIPVDLSRQRIKESPPIASDQPVSRQLESDLYGFYGYPPYWGGALGMPVGTAGPAAVPPLEASAAPSARSGQQSAEPGTGHEDPRPDRDLEGKGDPHLRSAGEVVGYYIQAADGNIGHVEDILIETDSWAVRYLMVDTRNWWPGRMVLISPSWASGVSWVEKKLFVDATREHVQGSPEYDPARPIDRGYEEQLHAHYGRAPYWGP